MKERFLISFLVFFGLFVCATLAHPGFAQEAGGRAAAPRNALEARIKAMDTNGDGAIDKSEYLAHAEAQFKRLDLNGDGKITLDELQKIRERRGAKRGADAPFP